ncbi:hypothetical protein AX17_004625 [Amanita inopinata Kibby_2008]|nr:hypothetical protein AX17_004625 [Amanita inopinata Kibby_2008]
MAPVRTKQHAAASNSKKSQTHRSHKKEAGKDSDALPGVQKLKSSLRQTRRLLAKDNVAADVRVETERRLKALESDLHKAELVRQERHHAVRYHKIKFFERQKVVRKIQQTNKRVSSEGDVSELHATLSELRVDLNYILHYPKTKKYISLFPPEVRKGESPPSDSEATKTNTQREEIRSWIRQKMEAGDLSATPEENANSKNVGLSSADLHGPVKQNSKAARKAQSQNVKPADDIKEDTFFGDDDDEGSGSESE